MAFALPAQDPMPLRAGPHTAALVRFGTPAELPELLIDEPGDGAVWGRGRDYKAAVSPSGVVFHPYRGSSPGVALQVKIAAVTVGGEPLALAAPELTRIDGSCRLDHGALVERFDLRPEGVEQSWMFDTLPRRDRLVLTLAMDCELPAVADAGGVRFGDGDGNGIRYGAAIAIDAAGRRLALAGVFDGETLQFSVPTDFVATATLPLVVDPMLTTVLVTAGPARRHEPDLAFDETTNTWLVVWMQEFAANDWDVWASRRNRDLTLLSTLPIEITSANWQLPRVANMRRSSQFLVVAENWTSTVPPLTTVVGRRVTSTAGVMPPFVLDAATNCSRPDVGGDPYSGAAPVFWLATWVRGAQLVTRTIDESGAPGASTIVTGTGIGVSAPALSNSNREDRWLLAFTNDISPTVSETRVAVLDFDGLIVPVGGSDSALVGAHSGSFTNDAAVSSPNGAGEYMIAWIDRNDVHVRAFSRTGSPLSPVTNLQVLEGVASGPGSVDEAFATVETDGVRFAVGYSTVFFPSRVTVSTLALTGGAAPIRIDEARLPVSSPLVDAWWPRLASPWASSVFDGITEFGLAYRTIPGGTANYEIIVGRYEGHSATGGFSTFGNGCGNWPSLQATGVPALGRTITYSLGTAFPVAGFAFGTPGSIPLGPSCPCVLYVDNAQLVVGTALSLTIPPTVSLVGSVFSCQGFTFAGGPCFGTISLTPAIDLRVQ